MDKKFNILIADDEESIIELLKDRFEYEGLSVSTALSGNQAIKILKNGGIDLVLSDYRMPDGDGMAVLNELKNIPEAKRPPFYFMSAYADISEQSAITAGAKKFYHKPFSVTALIKDILKEIGDIEA